jgi:hypothetical protein
MPASFAHGQLELGPVGWVVLAVLVLLAVALPVAAMSAHPDADELSEEALDGEDAPELWTGPHARREPTVEVSDAAS